MTRTIEALKKMKDAWNDDSLKPNESAGEMLFIANAELALLEQEAAERAKRIGPPPAFPQQMLEQLKPNWDGEGARAPTMKEIVSASMICMSLPNGVPWNVVPLATGGVQIESHAQGLDVEITVSEYHIDAIPNNHDTVVIGKRRCGCVVACDQDGSTATISRYLALGYIVARVLREEGLRLFNATRLPCPHQIES